MAKPAEIYEFIVQQGTASTLPGAWQRFSCDGAFFDLPTDQAALMQRLQVKFDLHDLVKAPVMVRDGQDAATLAPRLSGSPTFIVAQSET